MLSGARVIVDEHSRATLEAISATETRMAYFSWVWGQTSVTCPDKQQLPWL